jgi:hypothetical protein
MAPKLAIPIQLELSLEEFQFLKNCVELPLQLRCSQDFIRLDEGQRSTEVLAQTRYFFSFRRALAR